MLDDAVVCRLKCCVRSFDTVVDPGLQAMEEFMGMAWNPHAEVMLLQCIACMWAPSGNDAGMGEHG